MCVSFLWVLIKNNPSFLHPIGMVKKSNVVAVVPNGQMVSKMMAKSLLIAQLGLIELLQSDQ